MPPLSSKPALARNAGTPYPSAAAITAPRAGFALVISLMLMGFIIMLMVALSSLTRVEIQTTSLEQDNARARQYALTGLYIAIGQLQEFAGQDQRITAAADLGNGTNGLPNAGDGTRFWTGVWGNANAPDNQLSRPVLLNWLVSGNEHMSVRATDSGSAFGRIEQPSQNATPPFEPVSGITLATDANPSTPIPLANGSARLLVGPASTAGNPNLYVIAPAQPIKASGAASDPTEGYYAYWIGDEGVKARINLADHWSNNGTGQELDWSFANAQRTAGESFFPNLPKDDFISSVISTGQLLAADSTLSKADLGEHFHDLTLHSQSVLADARRGGLKRDLTRILETGGGSADEASSRFIFADRGGAYSNAAAPFYTKPPTWGLLRDFAAFANASHTPLPLQTPTATRQGIHPVLVHVGVSYTYRLEAPVDGKQRLVIYATPLVILWNPYNRQLSGGTFEIGVEGPRKADDQGIVTFVLARPDPSAPADDIETSVHFNLATSAFETTTDGSGQRVPAATPIATGRDFLRFTAEAPALEPGQAVYLGIPNNSTSDIYSPGSVTLTPRPYSTRFNYSNVARVQLDEILVPASNDLSLRINMRDLGETTIYLGKENAGADVNAALDASSDDYYQWIGQIGADSKYIGDPSGILQTKAIDVGNGSGANPKAMVAIDTVHQFGNFLETQSPPPLPVRWIAQANPRAYMTIRTELEPDGSASLAFNPAYFSYVSHYDTGQYIPADVSGTNRYIAMRSFTGSSEATVGNDYNNASYAADNNRPYPQLFELPAHNAPLFSIANLQHAALSTHATSPSYAIGNSLANFRIKDFADTSRGSAAGSSAYGPRAQELYDLSFLLNDALWDRYFFSTIQKDNNQAGSALPQSLPNSRYSYTTDAAGLTLADLSDAAGRNAAAHLLTDGGFNVNSTSVQAWKAVLGGLNDLAYDPVSQASAPALSYPFSRFRNPRAGSERIAPGVQNARQYWGGYRQLTDAELTGLAERMVAEVRARGPFLSMSDFVNRSIDTDRHTGSAERYLLKGALQSAIDDEGTLGQEAASRNKASRINFANSGGGYQAYNMLPSPFGSTALDTSEYNLKALAGWNSEDFKLTNNPFTLHGSYNASYLTQADILSAIGASLSARSDTFVIRAYGEAVNPQSGQVIARAWCEAVIQRRPQYLMPESDSATTAPAALQSSENKKFGRRFEVVSFRWLQPDNI